MPLFDPERFSDEIAEHRRHSFMWIPFGGGAHKCIGMHFARMLFLLTFRELLAKHQIEFAKPDYYPAKLQHFPFTRPLDNLPVKLARRASLAAALEQRGTMKADVLRGGLRRP